MRRKSILLFISILFCVLLFSENVYAASKPTKCIYKKTNLPTTITFTVIPNGKGSVSVDSVEFSNGGYQNSNSSFSGTNFVDNTNNIVKCPQYLYTKTELGANYKSSYTLSFTTFDNSDSGFYTLSDSENDGQALKSGNGITEVNACTYTGQINGNVVTSIIVHAYSDNTLKIESTNKEYTVKFIDNNSLTAKDFKAKCPGLFVQCSNSDNYKSCSLSTDAIRDDYIQEGDTTPDSETLGSEYTCSYKGRISGKKLIISKYATEWVVTRPDGSPTRISTTKVGTNIMPSSNCEDIFYLYNRNESIKMVDHNKKYVDETIAGYCRGYGNEVEQFCYKGECNISKPLCGSNYSVGDNTDDIGNCPKELKPVIWFIKKVVFNMVQLFIPIILILMGTIDLVKAMMASDDKGNKESISKFIKRVAASLMIFFIVTIVSVVMNMFTKTDLGKQNDWKACWHVID